MDLSAPLWRPAVPGCIGATAMASMRAWLQAAEAAPGDLAGTRSTAPYGTGPEGRLDSCLALMVTGTQS